MSLVDPKLPKKYKNQKVLFEQNLDAWRKATEAALALSNLNLTQLGKDLNGNVYDFNNAGTQSIFPDIQTQINNIISGATPITGTTSDTWSINTDGNTAILDTVNLTAVRNFFFPDISGTFVMTEGNQTINGVKTFTANIPFKSGTAFLGTFDHVNTVDRIWNLPDIAGNIPVLPSSATTESGSGAILRSASPSVTGTVSGSATYSTVVLTSPTIASNQFVNAQHDHSDAAHGGAISISGIPVGSIDHNSLNNLAVGDVHTQYLILTGARAMTGALNMGTHLVNNVLDPVGAQDAATKNYVDTAGFLKNNVDATITADWTFPSAPGTPDANAIYRQGYAQCGLWYRIGVGVVVDFNIDSVTDLGGAGNFQIFWDRDFAAANSYIVQASGQDVEGDPATGESYQVQTYEWATNYCKLSVIDDAAGGPSDDDFSLVAWGAQ